MDLKNIDTLVHRLPHLPLSLTHTSSFRVSCVPPFFLFLLPPPRVPSAFHPEFRCPHFRRRDTVAGATFCTTCPVGKYASSNGEALQHITLFFLFSAVPRWYPILCCWLLESSLVNLLVLQAWLCVDIVPEEPMQAAQVSDLTTSYFTCQVSVSILKPWKVAWGDMSPDVIEWYVVTNAASRGSQVLETSFSQPMREERVGSVKKLSRNLTKPSSQTVAKSWKEIGEGCLWRGIKCYREKEIGYIRGVSSRYSQGTMLLHRWWNETRCFRHFSVLELFHRPVLQ